MKVEDLRYRFDSLYEREDKTTGDGLASIRGMLGDIVLYLEEQANPKPVIQRAIEPVKVKAEVEVPPVDRTARVLANGKPVTDDHREINPITGQQKDYVVLTEEERSKGFVRPVRRSYKHLKCGTVTTMAQSIAETYARDPDFYSGGFCCGCRTHFPHNELVWADTGEQVGS